MALFERKSPTPADLIRAAEDDYHRAEGELVKLRAELEKVRHTPPCLSDAMAVLREVVKSGSEEFHEIADGRLKYLCGPEFDRRYLYDLNLSLNERSGSIVHSAMFGLFGDQFLQYAEGRLLALGCGKSKLTLADKAAKMAALEAEIASLDQVKAESLNAWRKLTGTRTGAPE